jgi:hypothetical protein
MHGPSRTPQEAVATVARHVARLEALGLDRDQAIRHAAADYGIAPEKVRWCAEKTPGAPGAAPVESRHGGDQPHPHSERRQHPIHAQKDTTMSTTPGPGARPARARLALAVAALTLGALAAGAQVNAWTATLNVNA